jgi:type II secretory ATPase GspE/PulE/Tfp pilus assembly ATPase PilB-like protein
MSEAQEQFLHNVGEAAWMRRARALGVPVVGLPPSLDASVVALVDARLARECAVVPLSRGADGRIVLAAADTAALQERVAELEFALGALMIVAASPGAVHALLARYYAAEHVPMVDLAEVRPPELRGDAARAPTVAAYVDNVLDYAAAVGASDIHFEPGAAGFSVRLRVDGELRALPGLPAGASAGVMARLKVLAGLDIGVTRRAQDGRITGRQGLDMRLATLPTAAGECAVLRLLDASRSALDLSALGMPEDCQEALREVSEGQGLVLACGPTGSGKTTSLHAALRLLDARRRKILTVEDPVEYELEGAVQVQARPEIGLGFEPALRSFLRHDPDVILVGEIRDAATARIAMRAALTGHLVYASLHTGGAAEAPLRLVELGLEPWLVGSALELAFAQQLVRKRCAACRGSGCPACGGSGASGRIGVYEWLRMTPELGALLDAGHFGEYLAQARERITVPLATAARRLAAEGLTLSAE